MDHSKHKEIKQVSNKLIYKHIQNEKINFNVFYDIALTSWWFKYRNCTGTA